MGLFVSCTKEESAVQPQTSNAIIKTESKNKSLTNLPFNVGVEDGILSFPSVDDYKRLADEPDQSIKQRYLDEINSTFDYVSLAESPNNVGQKKIDSGFLSTILNENFTVIIDSFAIKLDQKSQIASLLETSLLTGPERAKFLHEDLPTNAIKIKFSEDVLQAIVQFGNKIRCCRDENSKNNINIDTKNDNSSNGGSAWLCTESGVGGKSAFEYINAASIQFSADYKKWPLYCELEATAHPWGSSSFSYYFDFTGGMPNSGWVHYKPKCESAWSFPTITQGSWKATKQAYQAYSGTKFLNEIYFAFYVKNQTGQRISNLIVIRANK